MADRRPVQLSASLLNADFARLGDEVQRAVDGGVDSIHLDVMDGRFVPNISFGAPVIRSLRPRTTLPFHTHLMVEDPEHLVADFAAAGSDLIVTHVEASADPASALRAIRASGARAGLALNPETDAAAVLPYLEDLDLLLVMTVHPGFGGQAFLEDVLPKIETLAAAIRTRGLDLPIGIDGGVNRESIGPARRAGGDVMVIGSALYRTTGELSSAVAEFRAAAEAAW